MKYFLVNQKHTYKHEAKGEYIWAPLRNKAGNKQGHWESLLSVSKGDIILSNVKGKIVSIGIALGEWYSFDNPFDGDEWKKEGRKVDVRYYPLKTPFVYSQYIDQLFDLQPSRGGILGKHKRMNQGYLFHLTKSQFDFLAEAINNTELSKLLTINKSDEESIFYNELIEEQQQSKLISENKVNSYSDDELVLIDEKNKSSTPEKQDKISKRIKTDARLKATRLEKSSFLCEINPEHKTFLNVFETHQYYECHHLIPLKAQDHFPDFILDSLANLVSVCSICHAQAHHGSRNAKEEIFWKMYKKREKELYRHGITKKIMEQVLLDYYF